MDYKEVIIKKRIRLGYSRNKLSQLIGISQTFIIEIEKGEKKPSLDILLRLCEVLNLELLADRDER